jgi:hypothetical protein
MAFVDQYATTRKALEKMAKDDPKALTAKPFGDGFHTSPPGGLLMAHAILTGLNAPSLVSDVTVDTGKSEAETKACKVEDLKATNTAVSFTRTDKALPLPVQKNWLSMLPYTNELKDLNYYGLTVKGLKDDEYTVSIDGAIVGKYTAKELAAGVNLGNATSGPLFDQANKVMQAISAKNGMVNQRFFGVVMFNAPDWLADVAAERKPAELTKRMDKINAAQENIYKLAKPVARKFEIKSAP